MYSLRIVHGSHDTIHTFKINFVIVFSVFNKINCIRPLNEIIYSNANIAQCQMPT